MNTSTTSSSVRRSSAYLADGREIFYYDETDHPDRVITDPRDLPPTAPASRVRYDQVQGEWIGVAGHRQTRTYHPPADACPLCPSTAVNLSEIPSPSYDVAVFENRFPSFAGTGEPLLGVPGDLFIEAPGVGRCEVVCFTSEHDTSLSQVSRRRMRTVIEAWADRTAALQATPGVEQVFCFENRGVEIGVTLAHPHGQIYGYPFVTPKTATAIRRAAEYRSGTGHELFADIVEQETTDGSRVVAATEHWVAFVPFAARWPFEVHLYPRAGCGDLTELDDPARDDLAALYLDVVGRLEALFDDPLPAITGVHQRPLHADPRDFALHLEVFTIRRAAGKIKYLAGSESAMGAFVNDITPETAAQRLREVGSR
ncbi:MAG: galactose-1-phosphate uridylyltransferase [Actinomycetales bacterium]